MVLEMMFLVMKIRYNATNHKCILILSRETKTFDRLPG